ncbi:MAG: stage II sporulation protein R [Dysosmobacter sp.]|nr:stage II sporulation protein R [Dysosmobacter sp.]
MTDTNNTAKTSRRWKRLELALLIGLLAALIWGMWSIRSQQVLADKVVRLHILANSDSEEDQALKLQVRDAVLERAEEILERAHDRSAAEEDLREALPELREIALETVAAQGYDYDVTAELTDAAFPTREYDGFTLPAGEYLALRLVIGAGEGHNWWCVVFPPLCAQTTTDVAQTAMAAGLDGGDVSLLTEESRGYVLKFKSIELWEGLRQRFG